MLLLLLLLLLKLKQQLCKLLLLLLERKRKRHRIQAPLCRARGLVFDSPLNLMPGNIISCTMSINQAPTCAPLLGNWTWSS